LLPDDVRYRSMRRFYEETASVYFNKILSIYFNDAKYLEFLVSKSANDKALAPVYERILNLNPKSVIALNALGMMRIDSESWQEAEDYLSRAVRLNPKFGSARYNLGFLLDKTGRHAEALKQWQEAATVAKDGKSANQLGLCLEQEGRIEEAIRWFRMATGINPAFRNARLNLARALYQAGQRDESLMNIRYVLKLDPEDKTALDMLSAMESRQRE